MEAVLYPMFSSCSMATIFINASHLTNRQQCSVLRRNMTKPVQRVGFNDKFAADTEHLHYSTSQFQICLKLNFGTFDLKIC